MTTSYIMLMWPLQFWCWLLPQEWLAGRCTPSAGPAGSARHSPAIHTNDNLASSQVYFLVKTIFWNNCVIILNPVRHQYLTFFKNVKTKILIFEYFQKISSEMNSTYPFYPILMPTTPYVFFFFLFVGGPKSI